MTFHQQLTLPSLCMLDLIPTSLLVQCLDDIPSTINSAFNVHVGSLTSNIYQIYLNIKYQK